MDKHVNPSAEHEAQAPYNFIALNETVVLGGELPARNVFHDDRRSGIIECTLRTESPLYIAGDKGEDVQFFNHGDPESPVIPGSSLRGMLRTLVEIITFSKLQPVVDKQLFFRDIRDKAYQNRFVTDLGTFPSGSLSPTARVYGVKVKAGLLQSGASGYQIECCEMARVEHNVLARDLGASNLYNWIGQREFPDWAYQGMEVWANVGPIENHPFPEPPPSRPGGRPRHPDLYLRFCKVNQISASKVSGWQSGVLVITGNMMHKKLEFVFLRNAKPKILDDPKIDTIVQRLEDDDQISEWQEKAFPLDKPTSGCRRKKGGVRDGEPVFYIEDSAGNIEFMGRAQLFRLPFGESPIELLSENHKPSSALDMAEAIFGFVDKPHPNGEKNKKWTAAGRVFVSDATLKETPEESIWLDPQEPAFWTKILSSPKPTAYAHYLVQTDPNIQRRTELKNYRQKPKPTLRGHKWFWHQGKQKSDGIEQLEKTDLVENQPNEEQNARIKPLRPGVKFSFQVRFEDLTPPELGSVLWSIVLPGAETSEYRHKLGMGKPLGMGSVQLSADHVKLLTPDQRYSDLFDGDNWKTSMADADAADFIGDFETFMEGQLGLDAGRFRHHERVRELLTMLRWPAVNADDVAYMNFDGHRDRPVLPTPEYVYSKYRLIDPDRTSDEETRLDPDTNGPLLLKPGDIVRGEVFDVRPDGTVFFGIDDISADNVGTGQIRPENLGGKKYSEGLRTRCKVISVFPDETQPRMWIIDCKIVPKS